ncbi:hypothetical protein IKQ19_18865 [Candidatus Saccharibacteria bacterium]|nr:hypothetical protein [Candidatus Saccharibacteria bacterium]
MMNIPSSIKTFLYGHILFILFALSACAITEKIPEIQNQESTHSTNAINEPILPEKFPAPKDYDKAYSYRTNSPNQTIVSFINNSQNDSLRLTDPELYIQSLVALIDSTRDEFEKVKMAYDAVALLLDYDVEGFTKHKVDSQQWSDILISRKAVCAGFANLFKQICDLLKIPCEKVHGYARGLYKTSLDENTSPNHAWNIVKIQNYWYFIDCTWGSGALNQNNFQHIYNTDWLFVKSDHFIYTHFPADSNYQLMQKKVSLEEFKKTPRLNPVFFEKYSLDSHFFSVNNIDSSFSIDLKKNINENARIIFYNYESGTEVQEQSVSKQDTEKISTIFHAPAPGLYIGVILYNVIDSLYSGCGYFLLNAHKASSTIYPTPMRSSAQNVEIISPLVALEPDSTYTFTVKVPNKKYVLLFCNGKKNRLKQIEPGVFSKKVKIPKNAEDIFMSVSNEEYGAYEAIAKFKIKIK